jgi:hypothetical protein
MAPRVLIDIDHSHAFMREETFGPDVPVLSDHRIGHRRLRSHRHHVLQSGGGGTIPSARAPWRSNQHETNQVGKRRRRHTRGLTRRPYKDEDIFPQHVHRANSLLGGEVCVRSVAERRSSSQCGKLRHSWSG